MKISIDAASNAKWKFKLQKRRYSDGLCDTTEIETTGTDKRTEIILNNLKDEYREICLIPANIGKETDNASYTYSVTLL